MISTSMAARNMAFSGSVVRTCVAISSAVRPADVEFHDPGEQGLGGVSVVVVHELGFLSIPAS